MKEDKIFIDRFDEKTYSISKYDGVDYVTDIVIVNNYSLENPTITFTTHTNLTELNIIIDLIESQQKDVTEFGTMIIELNGRENEKK